MKYYTPAETGEELGVSGSTLARWRHTGKFVPEFKTAGGQSRYSQTQIDKMRENKGSDVQPGQLKKNTVEDLL